MGSGGGWLAGRQGCGHMVSYPARKAFPAGWCGPDNPHCGIPWVAARPLGPFQASALGPAGEEGFPCQACPAGQLRG